MVFKVDQILKPAYVLVILLNNIGRGKAQFKQEFFSVLCENKMSVNTTVYSSYTQATLIKCGAYCQISSQCKSFSFNEATGECFLSSAFYTICDKLESKAGVKTYMVRLKNVLNNKSPLYFIY